MGAHSQDSMNHKCGNLLRRNIERYPSGRYSHKPEDEADAIESYAKSLSLFMIWQCNYSVRYRLNFIWKDYIGSPGHVESHTKYFNYEYES